MAIRVLLAEDNEIIRKVIADLLKSDPGIEVIAECSSFAEALNLASATNPEVVLMDVHMGDERTVTHSQLKAGLTGSRLLAMSIWNDDETKALAASYGAVALLDKTKLMNDLIPSIRRYATKRAEA